jgi:hypothetical protein
MGEPGPSSFDRRSSGRVPPPAAGCDDAEVSPSGPDPALEVLARHAAAVATVRAFADAANAQRVAAVLDGAQPALVEWAAGEPLQVTEGETTHEIPDGVPLGPPLGFAEVRPAPASAVAVDPEAGELAAPVGAISNLAEGVLSLAKAFGGRSVATADFATRDPELLLTIAARAGEPILVALGDRQFELPGDA